MIKYETPKGIVSVDLDKHRRPIFKLPPGMHGTEWMEQRDLIRNQLRRDYKHLNLTVKRHA